MFTYVFVFTMVSLWREWEPILIFVRIPAVSLRPREPIPRSHWDRGNRSRCLIETAEILWSRSLIENAEIFTNIFMSDPAVSLRPRDPIPRSHWDRGNRFCSLIENAGSDMKSYAAPAVHNWKYVNKIGICFPYIPQSQWDRGIGFRGLIETMGFDSAVSLTPRESLQKWILVLIFFGCSGRKPLPEVGNTDFKSF
jgi:hypothetical protein